jgi:hypothetical protein
MPRKSSRARARSRRLGILGLLLSAALTPAGIMVGTVAAGALVGGLAFHLERAAPSVPSTPTQSPAVQTYGPQRLTIEHDGKELSLVLNEDRFAGDDGTGAFDPPGPLPGGPGESSPAPHAAPGGMPPHASPGAPTPGGGKPSFAGPAPVSPFLAGPNGAPPGGGPSHPGSPPPAGTPPDSPSIPSVAGDRHTPTGGDTDEPPGESDGPAEHERIPPTLTRDETLPDPDVLPGPDALPGMPILPLAGHPLDSQTPPPGKERVTQPNAVPEPSMPGLILLGWAAMAWAGRRRGVPVRLA